MLFQIDIKHKFDLERYEFCLRVMLFQIDIKLSMHMRKWKFRLRVMLFQIDIKLLLCKIFNNKEFESNVILDRYKTSSSWSWIRRQFESNVILDRYKTL